MNFSLKRLHVKADFHVSFHTSTILSNCILWVCQRSSTRQTAYNALYPYPYSTTNTQADGWKEKEIANDPNDRHTHSFGLFLLHICVHITFARTKIYLCTLALLLLIVFKCCTQFTLLRIKNHLVNWTDLDKRECIAFILTVDKCFVSKINWISNAVAINDQPVWHLRTPYLFIGPLISIAFELCVKMIIEKINARTVVGMDGIRD